MKGNTMKVKDVPSAYTLWLARFLHQKMANGNKTAISSRAMKKGSNTFGFNAVSMKMMKLGYKPNYARYPSTYAWFD